ncbi:MAG: hypothetical protein H7062_17730 [Candidatus Saccharimonas sp.]|nr:hypothetical protein [Planctomycetaceae bacterium]
MPWQWPRRYWAFALLWLVLISPIVMRAWFLSYVSDVAEPFEVKGFYPADLPPAQNAFTHYNEAQRRLWSVREDWFKKRGPQATPSDWKFPRVFVEGLSVLSESEHEWLADQRATLDEWHRGTELPLAQAFTFAEMNGATLLPVHNDRGSFIALARIEALRCEADGDLEGAWGWCRACVRFSRHLNSHGGVVQRLVGSHAHMLTTDGVVRWAEHPNVTATQLREALAEIRAEYAKNAPLSEVMKVEYLFSRQTFATSKWTEKHAGVFYSRPAWEERVAVLRRPALWLVGEPDVYLRLRRQILLNQLNEIDKPLAQRPKPVSSAAFLFDPDPLVPMKTGQLNPAGIERGLQHSALRQIVGTFITTKGLDDGVWQERARQAALEALLAVQAFRREKGEFPESLDQLVPEYLGAVQLDPFDPNGGRLHYRRDTATNAVVWSVGKDGNDDGGTVDDKTNASADVGFTLKVSEPK